MSSDTTADVKALTHRMTTDPLRFLLKTCAVPRYVAPVASCQRAMRATSSPFRKCKKSFDLSRSCFGARDLKSGRIVCITVW